MVNLKEIQETLNSDPAEFKKFEADPVGYLESKGLTLPEDAKQQLVSKVQPHPAGGATWNVGIQVGPKS